MANKQDWKALQMACVAIKSSLETVLNTINGNLSDVNIPDERFDKVFGDLKTDINRWIKATEYNISYCKKEAK